MVEASQENHFDCYVRDGLWGTQNVGGETRGGYCSHSGEEWCGPAQRLYPGDVGRWREEESGVKRFQSWREQLGNWGCSNEVLKWRNSGGGAGQEPVWGTKVKNAFLGMLTIRCFVAMLHGQKDSH